MGSSSVPSSTAQYQQVATGIWGSPQATKLALPILKPALGNIKEQQDMLLGVQHGDPTQMAAFFGLPKGASPEEAGAAAHRYMSGPKIEMPSQGAPSQPPAEPTKLAARGGLMSLDDDERTFADGGDTTPKDLTKGQTNTLANLQRKLDANKKLSPANQKKYDSLMQTRQSFQDYTAKQDAGKANLAAQGITPAAAYLGQAGFFGGNYDPKTGTFSVTNPYYNQATDVLRKMNTQPEQFGQATQAYNQGIAGLAEAAKYQPKDVSAARMDPYERVSAAQMSPYERVASRDVTGSDVSAASVNRGDIRDIAAQLADVERYNAANIERTKREEAATTVGPKSWTDQGTAAQYMSPYMQNVTDIAKRESMRDYGKQLSQLRAQATGQKAFGGTRAALQEAEAQRGQAQRMSDIEAQGLQQAYQSGMGQFSAEQGLGAQVGMSNTSQINQLKQQYMSMGLSEAQANQAAINQASQFNAGSQNQAYNNYVAQQLQAQQANQQMDWNAANQNAQLSQQANLANQQYGQGGFQSQQLNQQAAMQAALANQQAGLTTGQQNAQLAQQAALANQQAGLTTAQQNAQLAQQANLANQNARLQANQQNIGAYGAMGNMAGGLGSLGSAVGGYNANLANMWGQAGSTLQGLGQGYFNQLQQNASNIYGGPTTLGNQGMNLLAGMGGGNQGITNQIQKIQ